MTERGSEPERTVPANVDVAEAARIIGAARRVLLTGHRNPDGDSVGSMLGLAHVLRVRGADVVCFLPEGVPGMYRFLVGAGSCVPALPSGTPLFDLAVAVDCGDANVLPREWPRTAAWAKLLVIDHHAVRRPFGDATLVRDVACVGQIVLEIAGALGHTLDAPLAEAVYVSLATDTGFFKYPSMTSEAFELAARLLRAGVSPWKVAHLVEEGYPPERLTMIAEILSTLRLEAGGRVAIIVVRPGLLDRLGLAQEHLENVINFARGVRGVEVAAQLRTNEEGKTRVSLRSRGRVDVAALARLHRGGGHPNAAGCTLDEPLDQAVEIIAADATRAVDASAPPGAGDDF